MQLLRETLAHQSPEKSVSGWIRILFPEILFAIFLIPTKYTMLSEKFNIPEYINPQNLLFIFFCIIVSSICISNEKFTAIPKRLAFSFICFLLMLVTGVFYSADPVYGKEKIFEFLTVTTMSCYAPFFLFRNLPALERFFKVFILLGISLSAFILIANPYAFQFHPFQASYPKFQTTFGSNYLSLQYIIGIAILVLLYYFVFKEGTSKKNIILLTVFIGFLMAAMLYSPGKNPIISLFLTVIIMTAGSLKITQQKLLIKKKVLNYMILIFAMGTILLSAIGWMFLHRLNAIFTPGYYGQVERIENVKIAFKVFLENPLLGAGTGSFTEYAGTFRGIERMKYPHNLLLEIASEIGSLGLFFLLAILFFAFKRLLFLKKKYRDSPFYHLPNVILALLIFIFLTSLTGGNINNPVLFALIGITFVIEPIIKKFAPGNLPA